MGWPGNAAAIRFARMDDGTAGQNHAVFAAVTFGDHPLVAVVFCHGPNAGKTGGIDLGGMAVGIGMAFGSGPGGEHRLVPFPGLAQLSHTPGCGSNHRANAAHWSVCDCRRSRDNRYRHADKAHPGSVDAPFRPGVVIVATGAEFAHLAGKPGRENELTTHLDHQHGDIVSSAGFVGGIHQGLAGILWRQLALEDNLNLQIGEHPRQAIAAQQ